MKVALLVGVSQYQKQFKPLKSPEADVDKMKRILEDPNIGEFDEVIPLINPDRNQLEESIYHLFANRQESDLLLFYFSGHGVKNMRGNLFFTLPETTKNQRGEVIRHKAVSARFLQDSMGDSFSNYQVVILDCCFSGAVAKGFTGKDSGEVDVKGALGGEGRAILTSSTSMQMSFQEDESGLSVYTRYLIEGLETGVADFNNDGWISVDEAHQYASQRVQKKSPAMTPQLFPVKEGYKINLAKAPLEDPLLQYRKEVQRIIEEDEGVIDFINGEFDELDRIYLDGLRDELQLDSTETTKVEKSVMEPLRQRYQKIQRYENAFSVAVKRSLPLKERDKRRLKDFQNLLGLRDEDIEPIHRKLISPPPSRAEPTVITPPKPKIITPPKPQPPATSPIPSPTSEVENISPFKLEPLTITIPTLKFVFTAETVFVDNIGKTIKEQPIKAYYYEEILKQNREGEKEDNPVNIRMIYIPAGQFFMGTPDEEIERLSKKYNVDYFNREKPQHLVKLPPFYLTQTPITQAQWRALASRDDLKVERDLKLEPSNFKGDNRPVEQVSWEEAVEFCQRLSKMTGKVYQLPSEAQWEYACRSVINSHSSVNNEELTLTQWNQQYHQPFHFGPTLTSDIANYRANQIFADEPKGRYREETTPVAQFPANPFGLYDMHGNVWEWCEDDYHPNYDGAPNDGSAWTDENLSRTKILRGGSWLSYPHYCRSANRNNDNRDNHDYYFGFRVMCRAGRT